MRYLELTLPAPEENLALDEALLDEAEAAGCPTETLRIWEPDRAAVVVGRSSRVDVEVRPEACRRLGIPILRRASGGAAVVTGPGCLMYALVLSRRLRPDLRTVQETHQFVLRRLVATIEPLVPGIRCRGTSDLALGDCKVSGNSLRAKHSHLLYHGTLLYDFRLELIAECLAMPPREPDYRRARTHAEFVANLPVDGPSLRHAVMEAWGAREPCGDWPRDRTAQLVADRYGRPEWNA